MTQCIQTSGLSKRRNRWKDKRKRQLVKLANMRAAKRPNAELSDGSPNNHKP